MRQLLHLPDLHPRLQLQVEALEALHLEMGQAELLDGRFP